MTKKNYQGYLLAANPGNPSDELDKAVILLIGYGFEKVVGLQINKPHDNLSFKSISDTIGIDLNTDDNIYQGGGNGLGKISVIHSTDWTGLSTVLISEDLAITNDISVLAALSRGEGPEYYRACAGHWLWERHQFDDQLDPHSVTRYKWEAVPARLETVFAFDGEDQWRISLEESARHQINVWF
jgi:putative AlgH/UPF0301 family transcriptional regulator